MLCNTAVCIKQVPHPDQLGKLALDPSGRTINRTGVPAVTNPSDRNALEEALKIKDACGGNITVITMGPPQARKALEEALAAGADNAVHLCDRAFAGADTLATAQVLAYGLRRIERYDLILCGNTTVDSGTGQVAVQVAELLGLPCVTDADELLLEEGGSIRVRRKWEHGSLIVRMKLPAVVGVREGANQPRLATVMGIISAAQKEILTWSAGDIGADAACIGLNGSPTQVSGTGVLLSGRQGEKLQGPPEETVSRAVAKMVKLEVL